ncbi:unnamed protein product [Cylicostephanus goldi]|uniref:Uncharacterized protein n=1 Tax=Cylicostephanus goldi TaxID=71465 RepID=A0A3P7R091_CYLGO|nr:unnamed protein product [Cylicostephanus goldi]
MIKLAKLELAHPMHTKRFTSIVTESLLHLANGFRYESPLLKRMCQKGTSPGHFDGSKFASSLTFFQNHKKERQANAAKTYPFHSEQGPAVHKVDVADGSATVVPPPAPGNYTETVQCSTYRLAVVDSSTDLRMGPPAWADDRQPPVWVDDR